MADDENPTGAVDAWACLIECNLATLEELQMLKSSSAARIRRQEDICRQAVSLFRALGNIEAARYMQCGRLVEMLEEKR